MRFDWAPNGSGPHNGLYLHMIKARFALFQLFVSLFSRFYLNPPPAFTFATTP